jgi:hypothetical protein
VPKTFISKFLFGAGGVAALAALADIAGRGVFTRIAAIIASGRCFAHTRGMLTLIRFLWLILYPVHKNFLLDRL